MMRAVTYSRTGSSSVLALGERPIPEPGPGEVRVRIAVSGVNPTDWKARAGSTPGEPLAFAEATPHHDGAGVVDAVGSGVTTVRPGDRVWVWEAYWQGPYGTAAEFTVLPERQVVALPDGCSFDLGASLGIPALTAHRCLTVGQTGVTRLGPGALSGARVLVVGGAGAVGHAAIELACWSGATVLTTVSGPTKADLARAAGAHEVIDYRTDDVAARIRDSGAVDIVVEQAPVPNASLYPQILAPDATVAIYALGGDDLYTFPVQSHFDTNTRFQFVLVYTVSRAAKDHAVADVSAALRDGALGVGAERGLPVHRFSLADTAAAQDAVAAGAVGKVLVDVLVDPV